MKKDRNSFFSQYGVSSYNTDPMMMQSNMNPMNQMNMPMYDPNMYSNPSYNTQMEYDLEAKINRMEREIKLLDQRLSKIESELTSTLANNEYNFANSMYMV